MFSFLKRDTENQLPVSALQAHLGKIDLIDIREVHEYKSGHVPKAKNIPMNTLLSNPDKYLKKEKTYHIICHSGGRSRGTVAQLNRAGYQVIDVTGGTGRYAGQLER